MADFATVVAIKGTGTVLAIDAKGNARVLKAGDTLKQGETVRTTGDAQVQLLMLDGAVTAVGPMESVQLDAPLADAPAPPAAAEAAAKGSPATIDDILQALERGSDLSEELDPAAAGLGGAAGGNDGGHSFVRLPRIAEPLEPLQYEYGYRAPEPLPDIPRAPQGAPDDQPEVSLAAVGGVVSDESTDLNMTKSAPLVDIAADLGDDTAGPASVNVELVIDRAESGLTTSDGHPVVLVRGADDNSVVGRFDSNGDGVPDTDAFTLTLGNDGVLSVTQHVALFHGEPGNFDEAVNLAGSLSVRVTAVDADGDAATRSVAVGDRISFEDDGPAIDVGLVPGAQPPTLVTQDAQTPGEAFDVATSAGSFAALFTVNASSGADQPASQTATYALSIGTADSGLASHGQPIVLAMDGADVVGRAQDGAAAIEVFRVSVDAQGNVRLTQYAQVDHLPEDADASNDNAFVSLPAGAVVLTASAAITDADLDAALDRQALDISRAIGFEDDVPGIAVSAVADAAITLVTQDAQTIGAASDSAQASFADAFATAVSATSGADAPAAVQIGSFHFNLLGTQAGLTSQGAAITLAADGADVVGRTAAGDVFRLSVNEGGLVTLTQYAQVDHLPESRDTSNDNAVVLLPTGLVQLAATASVTDFDNDTATSAVTADLGGNIRFEDDVPGIDVTAVAEGGITLTTQDAQTIGAASDTAQASFAAAFQAAVSASASADTPVTAEIGSYRFNLLGADAGFTSQGSAVTLAMDGSDVVGRTASGDVFRLHVDGTSGEVTLTQYAHVDHLPLSTDNAVKALPAGVVQLVATAAVTDYDQDQAVGTVSADLGGNVRFEDDQPSIAVSAVGEGGITLTTQDAQTIGAASDTAQAGFAAAFVAAVAANSGADAPASTQVGNFHFNLLGSDSGLSSQGVPIALAMDGADVVGRASSADIFRLHVDSGTGQVMLTQYAQVDHLPESTDTSNDNTVETLAGGVLQLVATASVTDYDQDTVSGSVAADLGDNIRFEDDVPSIVVGAVVDAEIALTTQDAQTVGAASDTAQADFAAAFLAAVTSNAGADAPASAQVGNYRFELLGTDTGLASHGVSIVLAMEGSDVVGRAGGTDIFRLHADSASGQVTLTQYAQVDHLPESADSSNDNTVEALPSGLVQLVATATVTDYDNDQATSSVAADLGGNVRFEDDVPSITVGAVADSGIVLTTQDAQTIGAASDTAQASFAAAFVAAVTSGAGADAPATVQVANYHFNLLGADTGLGSHGVPIALAMDGNDVVGRAGSADIFRLQVDATSGEVTLTQYAQVDHLPESADTSNDNAVETLPSGLVQLVATGTVTDYDNDQAIGDVVADLGGNVSFEDDLPSLTLDVVAESGITLATQDAQTIGTASDTAQASFAAAFVAAVSASAGADAPATVEVNNYHFNLLGTDPGLSSHGVAITLVMDGSDVVGRAAAADIFRLHVDNSSGEVTLTQYAQVDHLPESTDTSNDNAVETLAGGLVQLVATATVTDYDQDQRTGDVTADLGGNVSFEDDVPGIVVGAVSVGEVSLTTQDAQTIGSASDTAQANFAAAFAAAVTADPGADAPASVQVGQFHFNLLATQPDLASHGVAITLVMDGADVVGRASAADVFRLHVDGASGEVTLTQYAQIDHLPEDADATNDNAVETLGSGFVQLAATATVTDYDNDQASDNLTLDLGAYVSFDDDVPGIDTDVADGSILLVTQDAQTIGAASDTANASFAAAFLAAVDASAGADTPASTAVGNYHFNLLGTATGLTSQGAVITLSLDSGDVVGRATIGSTPTAIFRLHVDSTSGDVTLTQYQHIDHLPESTDTSNDNAVALLPDGLVELAATATVTDYDNDQATSTVATDLGGNVRFEDDVPTIDASAVAEGGITLTTQDAQTIAAASDSAQATFAAAFLAAVTANAGADVPASAATVGGYQFNILAANSGLDSGGADVMLSADGSDVVGRTTVGSVTTDVFRLHVDSGGQVTLTQYQAIDHLPEDVDGVNDNTHVALGNGILQLTATATVTDADYDQATVAVAADLGGNIGFDDDVPTVIQPTASQVVNLPGASGTIAGVALDTDGSVDDNFGADLPGAVRFAAQAGDAATVTTGTLPVYLYTSADGHTLLGSTLAASTFDTAWADRTDSGAFVVTLDPAATADHYDFQLLKQIDGALNHFSTETGSWAFEGGNTDYVYYTDLSGSNLPSILLTPSEGYRLNGTANEVGISGAGPGQNVGSDESVRIDFVSNLTGTPKSMDYVAPSTHQFDEHVMVNGAAVTFALNNAANRSTVNFRAYDDADAVDATPGEDDWVGDYEQPAGTSEAVTRVMVNGTSYTADASGTDYSVDFLADGSVDVSGVKDGDTVAIFTADGFTTTEIHYVSGDTFALAGFGATTFEPGENVSMRFDLGVYDSDGDLAVVDDGLLVTLTPADAQMLTPLAMAPIEAGAQALDLRDLLEGELPNVDLDDADQLEQYLHFTEVDGHASLQVDADGGSFQPMHVVALGNMTLGEFTASLGLPASASDTDIIREMLEQGRHNA